MNKILSFFDKLEDKIRFKLSRHPAVYAFIGGIGIVLFWRGVWHTADILQGRGGFWGWFFYEPVNLFISVLILLASGLFVSFFVGDVILISGIKKEKKIIDKTETELETESEMLNQIRNELKALSKIVEEDIEGHHKNDSSLK